MDKSLDLFCSYLSKETGLTFPVIKYSFVLNRITPILKKYNCSIPSDLISKSKQDLKLKIEIVNALTTNETWFFRHPNHFEIIKKDILPVFINQKKDKTIKIWSAGCSKGAELYSILITLLESMPDISNYRISLLGSDISYEIIQNARKAEFNSNDLKATNQIIIDKYFDKTSNNTYKIKEELKHYVTFEYMNLLENWPPRTFDIIFCRNTMIYFNDETKNELLKRFFKALEFGGFFFTSTNELVDIPIENYGIKKIFLRDEYIYQKTNKVEGLFDLYFNSPTDLLRATNLLRKACYSFQFGSSEKNKVRSLIISKSESDKIINYLVSNSIKPINIL